MDLVFWVADGLCDKMIKNKLLHIWKQIFRHNYVQRFLARMVYIYLRLVGYSVQWKIDDAVIDQVMQNYQSCIVCFWHDRLAMMPFGWKGRKQKFQMLISAHRDGRFIADIIDYFGLSTIHGSAYNHSKGKNNGGSRAYRELLTALKNKQVVGMTPDGPRGPRHKANISIVKLAAKTGIPIIPASVATTNKVILRKTWDQFQIPLPFKQAKLIFGQPIIIPNTITEDELLAMTQHLSNQINAMDNAVDISVAG